MKYKYKELFSIVATLFMWISNEVVHSVPVSTDEGFSTSSANLTHEPGSSNLKPEDMFPEEDRLFFIESGIKDFLKKFPLMKYYAGNERTITFQNERKNLTNLTSATLGVDANVLIETTMKIESVTNETINQFQNNISQLLNLSSIDAQFFLLDWCYTHTSWEILSVRYADYIKCWNIFDVITELHDSGIERSKLYHIPYVIDLNLFKVNLEKEIEMSVPKCIDWFQSKEIYFQEFLNKKLETLKENLITKEPKLYYAIKNAISDIEYKTASLLSTLGSHWKQIYAEQSSETKN